jgi:hypothetical protein
MSPDLNCHTDFSRILPVGFFPPEVAPELFMTVATTDLSDAVALNVRVPPVRRGTRAISKGSPCWRSRSPRTQAIASCRADVFAITRGCHRVSNFAWYRRWGQETVWIPAVTATPERVAGLDMDQSVVRMRPTVDGRCPHQYPQSCPHCDISCSRQITATTRTTMSTGSSQHVPHEFVDIDVDMTEEKKSNAVLPQDGQGLRSRGGHVRPPGLEGPDSFRDTMDMAGPLGPAWMRRCLSPDQVGEPC